MGFTVTDNFNRADESPIGGNWTAKAPDGTRFERSGAGLSNNSVWGEWGDLALAVYTGETWDADQEASIRVTAFHTSYSNGGPVVRFKETAKSCYFARPVGAIYVGIYETVNGYTLYQLTQISHAYQTTERLGLRVEGDTLSVLIDGSSLGSVTDATISEGIPGFFMQSVNATYPKGDDWEGISISGGGGETSSPPKKIFMPTGRREHFRRTEV